MNMQIPCQYPYDPKWRLIVFGLATGAAMLGLVAMRWYSYRVGIAIGGVLVVMALFGIVRRLAFRRFIEFRKDALLLPTGFLQFRMVCIPYSAITRAWEVSLPFTVVLRISTDDRVFDIPSILLPDSESYVALREFFFHQRWNDS